MALAAVPVAPWAVAVAVALQFPMTRAGIEAAVGVSGILARGGFPDNVVDDITYYRLFIESINTHIEAAERELQDRLNASCDCDEAMCVDC